MLLNQYENLSFNILIIGCAVVILPFLFTVLFSFIKFRSSKNIGIYINVLTASMLIILGSFGFFREALSLLTESHGSPTEPISPYTKKPDSILKLICIGVMVSGAFLGIIFSVLTRYFIAKKNELHQDHFIHNHSDHIFNLRDIDNKKDKWSAIVLLLNHRVVEAISLGILIVIPFLDENKHQNHQYYQFPMEKLGFIIIFIVHMIPEAIFIYHRQTQMGVSRNKALLNSFLMKIVIIPIMTISAFIIQVVNPYSFSTAWILPFLYSVTGSVLIFVSVIELIPEFIDNKDMSNKTWFNIIGYFTLGICFSISICILHVHH
ncbi:MAG: hypothetical protein ACRDCG_00545 [Mycoplasmoidaceae bacterium]